MMLTFSVSEYNYLSSRWGLDVLWTSNERLYKVQISYRRPLDVQRMFHAHWVGQIWSQNSKFFLSVVKFDTNIFSNIQKSMVVSILSDLD